MINTKQLREFFIQLLNSIENSQLSEHSLQTIAGKVKLFDECDEACGDIESLIEECQSAQGELESYVNYIFNYSNPNIEELIEELYELIENSVTELVEAVEQIVTTIQIFVSNLDHLKAVSGELGKYLDGSAEYFHTKANCEAAQLGDVGEKTATILGYLREIEDFPKEILFKGQSIKDAFDHSVHDLEVNEQGRKLGRENPDANPGDIIEQPDELPGKQKKTA